MDLSYANAMIAVSGFSMYFSEVFAKTFYERDLSGDETVLAGLAGIVLGAGITKVVNFSKG